MLRGIFSSVSRRSLSNRTDGSLTRARPTRAAVVVGRGAARPPRGAPRSSEKALSSPPELSSCSEASVRALASPSGRLRRRGRTRRRSRRRRPLGVHLQTGGLATTANALRSRRHCAMLQPAPAAQATAATPRRPITPASCGCFPSWTRVRGARSERRVAERSLFDARRRRRRRNRSARSWGRPADAAKRTAPAESRDGLFIDEAIFRLGGAAREPGTGARGGAGACAKRASGDGCARVADTSRASPRGRARDDARACASRPRARRPKKPRDRRICAK